MRPHSGSRAVVGPSALVLSSAPDYAVLILFVPAASAAVAAPSRPGMWMLSRARQMLGTVAGLVLFGPEHAMHTGRRQSGASGSGGSSVDSPVAEDERDCNYSEEEQTTWPCSSAHFYGLEVDSGLQEAALEDSSSACSRAASWPGTDSDPSFHTNSLFSDTRSSSSSDPCVADILPDDYSVELPPAADDQHRCRYSSGTSSASLNCPSTSSSSDAQYQQSSHEQTVLDLFPPAVPLLQLQTGLLCERGQVRDVYPAPDPPWDPLTNEPVLALEPTDPSHTELPDLSDIPDELLFREGLLPRNIFNCLGFSDLSDCVSTDDEESRTWDPFGLETYVKKHLVQLKLKSHTR